jgi:flagellar hook-associated protein 3 FlgL
MRVATNSFTSQFLDQVRTLSVRQNRLQTQAATGQRIQTAEDDPAAMKRVLDLQAEGAGIKQFQKNIAALTDKAAASYDIMRGLKTISDRMSELATLADGTRSPDELKIYGTEVGQLIEQAGQLVNGKHNGDYLFGGTKTDQPPFVVTKDANGKVTSVAYQGNTDTPDVEVAEGSFVSVQVPGANSSGAGDRGLVADRRTGADLFAHMIAFQTHLNAGDTASIAATDRPALSKDEDNLILQIGTNAAMQSRLEAAQSIATSRSYSVDSLVSKEASADLAQTLVQLNQTQTAYQAALQSGASIMQLSLLNYLR